MDWFQLLEQLFENGPLTYAIVLIILVLCGLGLPIPEEATFIVAGYVTMQIGGSLGLMIAVSLVGIVMGDSVTFYLGRRYGNSLLQKWPFTKIFTAHNVERSKDFFRRHGNKAIFIAGCMAGVRAPTFFLSGTMGMSYFNFLIWDGARALVTCPISIYVGWKFGPMAEEYLKPYKDILLIGLGLVVLFLVLRFVLRRRRKAGEAAREAGAVTEAKAEVLQSGQAPEKPEAGREAAKKSPLAPGDRSLQQG